MTSKKTPTAKAPAQGKKPFEVPLYAPPAQRAVQGRTLDLPTVEAPSLEGLSVTVSSEGLSAEDVRERLVELARPFATERMRSADEEVALEDEVLLNLVGYCQGRILPFSVQRALWVTLEPEPLLPGLYESLVGQKPGDGVSVDVVLPDTYPVESLRGQSATFLVHIEAARELEYPDLDDPAFLKAFGRGETAEQVGENITRQMADERSQVLALKAQHRVLDEVARRTPVQLPRELIDEEIRRRWGETEGAALVALELTDEEQEQSLEGWLKDPITRETVEQRLRIALALNAIIQRDKLELTPERLRALVDEQLKVTGGTRQGLAESLNNHPEEQERIEQVALHLMAVEHVMKKAQVRVEEA